MTKEIFKTIARLHGDSSRASWIDFKIFLKRYDTDRTGYLSGDEIPNASRAIGFDLRWFFREKQGGGYHGVVIDDRLAGYRSELPHALVMRGARRNWRRGLTESQFNWLAMSINRRGR